MPAPDRIVVADAFRVVPHAVGVDEGAARFRHHLQHPAVDVVGDAREHPLRRHAQARRPLATHQVVVGADAARRHEHGLGAQLEITHHLPRARGPALQPRRRQKLAGHPLHRPRPHGKPGDAVAEAHRDQARVKSALEVGDEGLDHARSSAPGDVEAGHRVAVADSQVAAALCPLDGREPADPSVVQPGPLLARREGHVGLGPAACPDVFRPVEGRAAQPVLERQLV